MRVSSGVKAKPVQAGGGGASSSSRPSGGCTVHKFTRPITERVGLKGARGEGAVRRWGNDAQRVAAELVLDRVTPGQGQYPHVKASARAYAANNTIPGAATKSFGVVKNWVRILELFRQGLEEVKVVTGRPSQKGRVDKLSPRGRAVVEVYFAAVHLGNIKRMFYCYSNAIINYCFMPTVFTFSKTKKYHFKVITICFVSIHT
jgi:hypothetical protein